MKAFCAFFALVFCALPNDVRSMQFVVRGGVWRSTLEQSIPDKDIVRELHVTDSNMGGRVDAHALPFPNLDSLHLENSLRDADPTFLGHLKHLYYVGLPGNNLTRLNAEWFDGLAVRRLNVSGNRIINLPARLGNLPDLVALDLSGNRIAYLPAECFRDTPGLRYLLLGGNHLVNVFPGTFGYLRMLDWLALDGNRLDESLDPDAFAGGTIKAINLSANRFETLPCVSFAHLKYLEELDLSGNNVRSLAYGCFSNLTALRTLKLTATGLSELPADAFASLTHLNVLDVGFNNLTRVDAASFANNPKLERLLLNHNKLTSLQWITNNPHRLYMVDLSHNRFEVLTHDFYNINTEFLLLSHNAIKRLQAPIFPNTTIHYLFLDNNCLLQLNASSLSDKVRVYFFGNPWECKCYEDFLSVYRGWWPKKRNSKFSYPKESHLGRNGLLFTDHSNGRRPVCAVVNADSCIVDATIEKEVYDSFRHVTSNDFAKCESIVPHS